MRKDGIFIAVEVDDAAADAELARKLTEACPVDIFAEGPVSYTHLDVYKRQVTVFAGQCLYTAPTSNSSR